MEISPEDQARLEALIGSEDSPVGIDAKQTHVIIIRKLERIEKRLAEIESNLSKDEGR